MAVVNDQAENHIKIIQAFIGRAYTEDRPKEIFQIYFLSDLVPIEYDSDKTTVKKLYPYGNGMIWKSDQKFFWHTSELCGRTIFFLSKVC